MKTFGVCVLQGQNDRLDLIELSRATKDPAVFLSKVTAFETIHLNNGHLTYLYIERPMSELRSRQNAVQAITSAPAGTRAAELVVAEDASEAWLSISFTLPKLALQRVERAMKEPTEKF